MIFIRIDGLRIGFALMDASHQLFPGKEFADKCWLRVQLMLAESQKEVSGLRLFPFGFRSAFRNGLTTLSAMCSMYALT